MRSRPLPKARFAALIIVFLLAASLVALLVACPPSPPPAPEVRRRSRLLSIPRSTRKAPRGGAGGTCAGSAGPLPAACGAGIRRHSAGAPASRAAGMLAVIIDDAGYSLSELQPFLELPGTAHNRRSSQLPHSTEAARRVLAAGKDLDPALPHGGPGGENPGRAPCAPTRARRRSSHCSPGLRLGARRTGHEQPHGLPGNGGPRVHECRAAVSEAGRQVLRGQQDHRCHGGSRGSRSLSACPTSSAMSSSTTTPTDSEIAAAFAKGVGEAGERLGGAHRPCTDQRGGRYTARRGSGLAAPGRAHCAPCGSHEGTRKGRRRVKILGIESSCDECSAAVVEDGRRILSNVILSQVDFHKPYYGVVPEIASRKHIEWIRPVVQDGAGRGGCRRGGSRRDRGHLPARAHRVPARRALLCKRPCVGPGQATHRGGSHPGPPLRASSRTRYRAIPTSACWSPAGTPSSPGSSDATASRSSERPSTTPAARRSTRWPSTTTSGFPAAWLSTSSPARETPVRIGSPGRHCTRGRPSTTFPIRD